VLKEECNQVISVCKMDISFKITVKQKCIHLTESILNRFSRSCRRIFHDFTSTRYANLRSLWSYTVIDYAHGRSTITERKVTSPSNIVCRHLCLSLMLTLFSIIDLKK